MTESELTQALIEAIEQYDKIGEGTKQRLIELSPKFAKLIYVDLGCVVLPRHNNA